ncbi:MAG: efflux RND transporter periplasmic adaptor subunit [Chitinophagales bacterium]|nr:efflux RND transporter periplasmic adaptor subunit [Chitinophagales bacterium]
MNRIFILLAMASLLLQVSCNHHEHEHEEESKFTVTSPVQKDTLILKDYVCQIRSINHIELRSQERGYLQEIYVDEGQFVKKGQLMFQIMPIIYQAEMEKAKANVSFAEIEYLNTKNLADSNIVSKNELALAKARLDKEKAELALAQAHLTFTQIRAPFDGIMDRFYQRLGSLVDEGELLTTLSDNSKMWVYFNVPEAEYLDYITQAKKDSKPKVKLLMANNQLYDHEGIVETIEADFNNETGNIAFRATFPNPDRILRHGETGNVQMPVHLKNVVLIPQKATFEILDKKFVFVVNEKGIVQSRQINVGQEMPHLYVVTDGLKMGEKVLIEGLRKVKNGEKIRTEFVPLDKVISELNKLHAE